MRCLVARLADHIIYWLMYMCYTAHLYTDNPLGRIDEKVNDRINPSIQFIRQEACHIKPKHSDEERASSVKGELAQAGSVCRDTMDSVNDLTPLLTKRNLQCIASDEKKGQYISINLNTRTCYPSSNVLDDPV